MEITATKRPCFKEGDDGLASLADVEAGFSGNSHRFFSRSSCLTRKSSLRNLSNCFVSAPRSARFYDARYEDYQPHFLEACSLCRKPLGDKDIFMYRGDTPFCSEECREQQIEIDEANEKNWNRSSSIKAALRKRDQKRSTSPTKSQDYPLRTRTVAAA